MRIFKTFNDSVGSKCPICKTAEKKETALIGLNGTQEGHNVQAVQVHVDCLELLYDKEHGLIVQKIS